MTGRVALDEGAVAIRAVSGTTVVTAAEIRTDGSFTLVLPAGTSYRLEVLTRTGALKRLVTGDTASLRDVTFRVCKPVAPYSVGSVDKCGDSPPGCDPATDPNCTCDADGNCPPPPCDPNKDPYCNCAPDGTCPPPPPPGCDPATDPNCKCDAAGNCPPPPCDPTKDPNCGCLPDGTCPPPPCDPNTDPTCKCDPSTGQNCEPPPPPCDPSTDPTCKCDPSTGQNCEPPPPCDPTTDPDCKCNADGTCYPPPPDCQPGDPSCGTTCDDPNTPGCLPPCLDPTDPNTCKDPCVEDPSVCGCKAGEPNCWPEPSPCDADGTCKAGEGLTAQHPPGDFGCAEEDPAR